MASKTTSSTQSFTPESNENEIKCDTKPGSISLGRNSCEVTKILSDKISLHAPNQLPGRLFKISFYDSLNNLISSVGQVFVTAKTELKVLELTLQDLLDSNIVTELCGPLIFKSLQIKKSNDDSYQEFSWQTVSLKDTVNRSSPKEKFECNYVKICGHWDEFRDMLLTDNDNFIQIDGLPTLKVFTIRQAANLEPLPGSDIIDGVQDLNHKMGQIMMSKARNEDFLAIEPLEKITRSDYYGEVVEDMAEDEMSSQTDANEEKILTRNYLEITKDLRAEDIIIKPESAQSDDSDRDTVAVKTPKCEDENEKQLSELFIDDLTDLTQPWVKEHDQTDSYFPIKDEKYWERDQDMRGINMVQASFSLDYPNHVDTGSGYWNGYKDITVDGLTTEDTAEFSTKVQSYMQTTSTKSSQKLTVELEKYRRMHESAISYANEDEELFFPLTPKTKESTDYTKKSCLVNEKHQMTQLELDKIVKDALVRKINKKKTASFDPLLSPSFNWYNETNCNQVAFPGTNFHHNTGGNQEQSEFFHPENMYAYDFFEPCGRGFDNTRQNYSPNYISNYGHDNSRVPLMNPDLVPFTMLNVSRNQNAEASSYLNQGLQIMDSAMAGYTNNEFNIGNTFTKNYRNFCGPRSSGEQFMSNNFHLGPVNADMLLARTLKNQMYARNSATCNRSYANGIY